MEKFYDKTWKKVVIAVVALFLLLSACGAVIGEDESTPTESKAAPAQPTETVTETVKPEPKPEAAPVDKDEVFLMVVRDEYPELNMMPDGDLVELATLTCDALDSGASANQVVGTIMKSSNDPEVQESMAFVMGSGVGIYCPEHTSKFDTGIAS